MPGFSIDLSLPVPEFKRVVYTAALREEVRVQVRQAARAWLAEAVKHIPVDSGEARGSLLPLARFLRVTASVPISAQHARANKNQTTGQSSGKQTVFDFLHEKDGEFFTIMIQLFHYWWNEFYEHNYPNQQVDTPWKSLEAGGEAFAEYVATEGIRKVPRIANYIVTNYITVHGTSKFKASATQQSYTGEKTGD